MVLIWKSCDYILIFCVFKKGSIHLNVFQEKKKPNQTKKTQQNPEMWETTVCCSPSLISTERDKVFSFAEMTHLLFSKEKEWWNSTDNAMLDLRLLFLQTKTFQVFFVKGTQKKR